MLLRPLNDLPALNACLNATSTILLVIGWIMARRGQVRIHGYLLSTALLVSALFLGSYLYYHLVLNLQTKFQGPYAAKWIYYPILATHIFLAVAIVPMIAKTVYHAARRQWDRHRRIARWTMPLWLYVSVTGVVVYVMLYQMFAPAVAAQ